MMPTALTEASICSSIAGGTGVARGYLNRPELTREVFVPNPLSGVADDIVYRTGDLGRVREDGAFEIIGRRDQQVKVRGVRVEISPIEVAHEAPPLKVRFPAHGLDEHRVTTLKRLLIAHPGPSPVMVTVGTQTIRLSDEFRVDETNGLRGELLSEFGASALA